MLCIQRGFVLMGMLIAMLTTGTTSLAAEKLVVFSGRSDVFVNPVIEAFTKQTGIEVQLHSAEATALVNKLSIEGKRTQADLFLSNDAGTLQIGSERGLFQALPKELTKDIPGQYRAADNTWVGLSSRLRVLVINSKTNTAADIDSMFDLADPALKGRVATITSANDSFIAGTTVYLLANNEEKIKAWLQGLKANTQGNVFKKHNQVVSAVADGKVDVGLVNHYYIYRHLAEAPDAPIRILLPDQGENGMGVAENVAGIAISKYSKNTAAAQKFIAFLTSEQGQKMFAEVNYEYPTRAGIETSPQIPPAGSFKVSPTPMYKLGQERNHTLDLIEAVGMP